MLKSLLKSFLAAGVVFGAGMAQAADLDQIIYAPELKRLTPVEIGNGWYLRGDVGYSFDTEGQFRDVALSGRSERFNGRIGSDFTAGGGVGYQFTDWLRADVTADYYRGTAEFGAAPLLPDAKFWGLGLLGNAYVDLGTFAGFTPYLGAGAGSTYTKSSAIFRGDDRREAGGTSDWRFTYALMAGVSYDLSKSMKVDLGYRYSDVAGGNLFETADILTARDNGFKKHEVRVGLRYSLW